MLSSSRVKQGAHITAPPGARDCRQAFRRYQTHFTPNFRRSAGLRPAATSNHPKASPGARHLAAAKRFDEAGSCRLNIRPTQSRHFALALLNLLRLVGRASPRAVLEARHSCRLNVPIYPRLSFVLFRGFTPHSALRTPHLNLLTGINRDKPGLSGIKKIKIKCDADSCNYQALQTRRASLYQSIANLIPNTNEHK